MNKYNDKKKFDPEILARVISTIFLMAFLQGCFNSNNPAKSGFGSVTGNIPFESGVKILAQSRDHTQEITVNSDGNFHASLPAGKYNILLQNSSGQLSLVKSEVEIENNLSVTITNAQMIPIPQVAAVSVPLLYDTSAVIEWHTNIESDGFVEYGTNELYGYSLYTEGELKNHHRIQLYNLLPATTYHFRIGASRYNLDSAKSYSRDFVFTTEP